MELESRWRATEGLTLSAAIAYLDFVYDEWDDAPCSWDQKLADPSALSCDRAGTTGGEPEWTANVGADYVYYFGGSLAFRSTLNLNYQGEATEDSLPPEVRPDSYTMVDLRLALEDNNWTVALLGKNLTDVEARAFSVDVPFSSSLLNTPTYTSWLQPPRTVSLQFDYRF